MKKERLSRIQFGGIFLEIVISLLICLWIYTGINKLMDYSNFRTQLGRSPFLESLDGLIAISLPSGELLLATLLVFRKTKKIALYLSFCLMLLFTGYIWIMLHYAYDLPCSCGGVLAKLSWNDHLLFNSIYTVIALIGVLLAEMKARDYPTRHGQPIANKLS